MQQASGLFIYFVTASVNLLMFCCGSGFSWTSPVIPKLQDVDPKINPLSETIKPFEVAWLASMTQIGCAFGPCFAGRLADKTGRVKALQCLALPLIIAYVMLAFAKHVYVFYIARFILGIGIGSVFQVVPMYLGEISEATNRGRICGFMSIFAGLGALSSYVIGPFLTVRYFSLFYVIPIITFLCLSVFIPESPIHLTIKGLKVEAEKSLIKLRCKPASAIKEELLAIVQFCKETNSKLSFFDIFKSRGLTRAFTINGGVALLGQLAGYMPVVAFMHTIFNAAGGDISPNIPPIIIGIIKCIVSIFFTTIIEKCDRKILLFLSSLGCGVTLTLLGTFFHLQSNHHDVDNITWLPLACIIFFMVSYCLGFLALPAVFQSELFPSSVKSSATNVILAACFVLGFVTTMIFPILVDLMGMSVMFWVFAGFCVFSVVFVQLVIFETKGKSLAEIQDILNTIK